MVQHRSRQIVVEAGPVDSSHIAAEEKHTRRIVAVGV